MMTHLPSYEDLQSENHNLRDQIERLKFVERINYTLYDIANAVHATRNLEELYQSIYDSLNRLIPLPNFYIAIYDGNRRTIHFEFFIDEYDDDFPIVENLEGPDCLTGEVILSRRPLFLKENMLRDRAKKLKVVGTLPKIWIGVPLIIQDHVIGIICAQHYSDPDYFTHRHLEILISISDQIAIAIERKQILDALKKKEKTLSLIMDHTSSIVAIMDARGIYEFANPAHGILGYVGTRLVGKSLFDLIHSEDVGKLTAFIEKGISGHTSHTLLNLRIKDIRDRFHQIDGTFDLIKDQEGFLEKIIFIGDDKSRKNDHETAEPTILVIEDDNMVRDMTIKALKIFGCRTLEAGDGETGLTIFKKNHSMIDGVLLDVILPRISGVETFKQMLEIDPRAKVIVTSGHVTHQDQKKVFAGACAHLDKPYQLTELKQAVKALFHSSTEDASTG